MVFQLFNILFYDFIQFFPADRNTRRK